MHFHDIRAAAAGRPLLSYELFPPRSPEAAAKAAETVARLAATGPDFASVTYGAGGGRRDLTVDFVDGLHFYTLNQAGPVLATLEGLGLADAWSRRSSHQLAT